MVAALCGAAIWAAETFHPMNVKAGQWETTVTTSTGGAPPIPPEVLARMTPEQRTRFEERMNTGRTSTNKHCVKQEDLDKPLNFTRNNPSCVMTLVTSTPSKQEIKVECSNERMKSSGLIQVEAADSEHVKGSVHMTMTSAAKPFDINTTFTSKWLGAACAENK